MLLALDMGAEYETLTARAFELGKGLCAANHGRLPTNVRRDSALGPQACELDTLYTRFMELMGGLMKTQNVAESELNAVRQEHFTELTSDVPDLRNFAALSANPEEKRRFRDIEEKYRPREEEKQKIVDQIRTRGVRFLLDNALWEKICDFSTSGQTERRPVK